MGKGSQTIGQKFLMSLHMGLGRGPFNEIADIQIGGISATGGDTICIAEEGQLYLINKPDLFGGDTKEGGIQGPIFFYNGASDQELQGPINTTLGRLPSIADSLGGDVPNFRGIVTAWFDGEVCAINPYPKEWSFRVRRTTAGWYNDTPWYPQTATITLLDEDGNVIRAMNPAHMLYEVNTNPEWGRGMPTQFIDENSYIYAANVLCSEGFGLCIPWFRQESIKEFIPVIIDHIDGVQYLSRLTGKMTLRLIRNDYDPDDLPLYTPDTGLLDIVEDDSSSEETAFNEVIVTGFDPVNKEDIAVGVQNLASIQNLEDIISNTIQRKGLPTRSLVARVAQRELRYQTPLRRFTCVFDRRGWRIEPGMPFRIAHPGRGIGDIIVRAGDANYGTLVDGKIEIKVVQDVFGMPDTSYVNPQPPIWTPPDFEAAPAVADKLIELNWRDYYLRSTEADRSAVKEGDSRVGMIAKPPVNVSVRGYDLATRPDGGDYKVWLTGGFTASTLLINDLGPLDTSTTLNVDDLTEFQSEFEAGMVALVGNEQIGITSLSFDSGLALLERGVADTIPEAHSVGDRLWLVDDEIVSDGQVYFSGETIDGKALTRTSTSVLDIDDATERSVEVNQRIFRPYPPGRVEVDGDSIYGLSGQHNEPVLTWTHRDRITQADQVIGHGEDSIGPEAGVTYRIRVYDWVTDTLLNTYDGISGDTWTYLSADQTADGAGGTVRVELVSVRDSLESFFKYSFKVVLHGGWGYSWGNNWG